MGVVTTIWGCGMGWVMVPEAIPEKLEPMVDSILKVGGGGGGGVVKTARKAQKIFST